MSDKILKEQVNELSPFIKIIMRFNSFFLMGCIVIMVIGIIFKIFSPLILPVSITHRGVTISEGFSILFYGSIMGIILICHAIPFFKYGIYTLRYLSGIKELSNISFEKGCYILCVSCIDCFIVFCLFKNILIIILLVLFIFSVCFNLMQLSRLKKLI